MEKYTLIKEDEIYFNNLFSKIFEDNEYPLQIFKDIEFQKLFFIKIPQIEAKNILELKNRDISIIKNVDLLKYSSVTWDKILYELINYFTDTEIFIKTKDYLSENIFKYYKISKEEIINLIANNDLNTLIYDITSRNMDDGFEIFGNNCEWGIYYSNYLLNPENKSIIDCDFFAISINKNIELEELKKSFIFKIFNFGIKTQKIEYSSVFIPNENTENNYIYEIKMDEI